jgi:hypothetical protein
MLASVRRGRALQKICVYTASGDWVDTVRIYKHGGKYLVAHIEDEDIYAFDSLEDALRYIGTERLSIDEPLKVGECPPPPGIA